MYRRIASAGKPSLGWMQFRDAPAYGPSFPPRTLLLLTSPTPQKPSSYAAIFKHAKDELGFCYYLIPCGSKKGQMGSCKVRASGAGRYWAGPCGQTTRATPALWHGMHGRSPRRSPTRPPRKYPTRFVCTACRPRTSSACTRTRSSTTPSSPAQWAPTPSASACAPARCAWAARVRMLLFPLMLYAVAAGEWRMGMGRVGASRAGTLR